MENLLNFYLYTAEPAFFNDFDERWNEYYLELQLKYRHFYEETVKRKKGMMFSDPDSGESFFLPFNYNPIIECYEFRRKRALNYIRAEIRVPKSMSEVKQKLVIYLLEFDAMRKRLEKMTVNKELEKYRIPILDSHIALINSIKDTYLSDEMPKDLRQPKIKWLGQTNQLGTLIYDLWQGSKGKDADGKLKQYPPLLSATKEDLMALIENNFTDASGNSISHSTLSGILNTSKSKLKDKASGEKRIELKYKYL